MPQLPIRKNQPETPARRFHPERLLPERFLDLFNWDPFREIAPLSFAGEPMVFAPAFEVKETESSYQFTADVPGVKEKDIEVTLTGNRLTVTGKREEEKREEKDTYYTYERCFGSFSRSFTLPEGIDQDHMTAGLKEGVLTIAIAKKPEMKPKKIAVSAEKAKA
jgi:HSP20 family protein